MLNYIEINYLQYRIVYDYEYYSNFSIYRETSDILIQILFIKVLPNYIYNEKKKIKNIFPIMNYLFK